MRHPGASDPGRGSAPRQLCGGPSELTELVPCGCISLRTGQGWELSRYPAVLRTSRTSREAGAAVPADTRALSPALSHQTQGRRSRQQREDVPPGSLRVAWPFTGLPQCAGRQLVHGPRPGRPTFHSFTVSGLRGVKECVGGEGVSGLTPGLAPCFLFLPGEHSKSHQQTLCRLRFLSWGRRFLPKAADTARAFVW